MPGRARRVSPGRQGVWHAAGVLADGLLPKQAAATMARVYGPKAHAAWLKEPGAFRRRDDALSASAFPKVPTTGEGVELCILLSASPASNPRETWSAAKQRQKGHSDQWSARPAALYPFKRRQWFDVCFADEPLVRAAAPFGALASHYRADEGGEE